MAITKEQVIDAAEQLTAEGSNPTMQAVRDRLGGGSFATISPILREWKLQKAAVTVAILEMPTDVKAALERFGAELWKAASALANTQLERLKEESALAIEAANRERDEALDEIGRLEAVLAQNDNQLSLLHEEVSRLRSLVEEEQMRNAVLQQRNNDLSENIEGLKADLKESREDGRKALEKLDLLRQEQADLSRVNGQLAAKVEAQERELAAMLNSRNELKVDYERLFGQISKASVSKGSRTESKQEKK